MKSLRMTKKEAEKVRHDINDVWHAKYKNIEIGFIYTHSHKKNSPSYVYVFINHGFDDYEFIGKYPTVDRR